MPLFRKSLDQIKSMLGQMTFSQQALMVLLVLVIGGCVVWMVRFSGQPDRVPVFDQSFEPEEQNRLTGALAAAGIEYDVAGGKVLVASGDRARAQVALAANDALPRDFSLGFEQVVKDSSIWRSETEKDRMWQVAAENELAAVLRQFPGVRDAKVIVDRARPTGFGRNASAAGSAAVHLRMKSGQAIDRKLITAVADWVSGAVRDLPRDRVKVVDSTSGRSFRVPGEDAAVPSDLLELATQYEKHFADSIRTAIGHIDNVLVSVSVKVEPTSRQETAVRVDKGNAVSVPSSERTSKSSGSDGGGGGEPGVASNTGVAIAAGAGGGSARSEQQEETRYEAKIGETRTVTTELPGALRDLSASVNIPRSFLVAAFKAETGAEQVDPAALKNFMTDQVAKIRPKVLAAIGLTESAAGEKVAVGWYYDTVAAAPAAAPAEETAGTIPALLSNARSIGLGALAFISLAMMLLMMRKAAASGGSMAAPAPMNLGGGGGGEVAYVSDGVVGEAGVADGYLQGMEVDEETLRTRKMVEQVASMVKENPDGAANLVRRWITRKSGSSH